MDREYKLTIDIDMDDDYKEWNTIGKKDIFKCPECEYLGIVCDRCGGRYNGYK